MVLSLGFSKQLIYNLYVSKKLTTYQVSKELNCSQATISHYLHKHNIPARFSTRGENNSHWKGGYVKSQAGYIDVYIPEHPYVRKRYVLEHRLVVEASLNGVSYEMWKAVVKEKMYPIDARFLERWEIVHHKNGIRDDNRKENLELLPNQTIHLAINKLLQENKRLKEENKRLKIKKEKA